KMIGNAVPPLFTFYVAQAMLGATQKDVLSPEKGISIFEKCSEEPRITRPDSVGSSYPKTRRFRAAIPNLRFKSGVRFEFVNLFEDNLPRWKVSFYFGNSKNIAELELGTSLLHELERYEELRK